MCYVWLTRHPCNHFVVVARFPCGTGMQPQICHPSNVRTTLIPCQESMVRALQLSSRCPALLSGPPCEELPRGPKAFAEFCLRTGKDIVDAIAKAPNWVFDIDGNKIGSMSYPWRTTDYITEFYKAKNATALRNRSSELLREKTMTGKSASKRRASEMDIGRGAAPTRVKLWDEAVYEQVKVKDSSDPSPESLSGDDF